MADAKLTAALRAAGPFRELSSDWIDRLAMYCTRRQMGAGDYVWRHGDLAQSFIVVKEGLIAVQRVTADGESVLVALFGPGDALCMSMSTLIDVAAFTINDGDPGADRSFLHLI